MIEVIVALTVLGGIGVALHGGARARTLALARDYHETLAARAAAARLERYRAGRVVVEPGERPLEIDARVRRQLTGVRAREIVRAMRHDLVEVEVVVDWLEPGARRRASVALHTRIVVGRHQ